MSRCLAFTQLKFVCSIVPESSSSSSRRQRRRADCLHCDCAGVGLIAPAVSNLHTHYRQMHFQHAVLLLAHNGWVVVGRSPASRRSDECHHFRLGRTCSSAHSQSDTIASHSLWAMRAGEKRTRPNQIGSSSRHSDSENLWPIFLWELCCAVT